MPRGDLLLQITDMAGQPIRAKVEIDFKPIPGEGGTGGARMGLTVNMANSTDLHVTGLQCRGGPATVYEVSVQADHRKRYGFFQPIQEDRINPASEDAELWVEAGDVRNIDAPRFAGLDARLRQVLTSADMREDAALTGLQGEALYKKLAPMQKACLLNIARKASHRGTADNSWKFVQSLMISRQDRIFALVDSAMPEFVLRSPAYGSADPSLHTAPPGFTLTGQSVKSRDAHANLQVTFMAHDVTGQVAADIDIDESSGIKHGLEVIRNAVTNGKTNPYLIREFLLAADPREHTLDPGYGFIFV